MKKLLLAIVFLMTPGLVLADDHTSIVEFWKCELKEDVEMDDVRANNAKWVALTQKTAGTEEVVSYMLTTIVGDQTKFLFADIFPDMKSWAAAKSAEDSDEGKAIEEAFDAMMDCEDNRLYKSERQ